jgi:hypothetical protein
MASSSSGPAAKRPRTDGGKICSDIAKTGLALAPQARCTGVSRWAASSELHKYDEVVTPYGPLFQSFPIGPDAFEVEFMSPFAMLWHLCSTSLPAAEFLVHHLAGKQCRLAFYCDGVTPGNVLRPDCGRSFEAIYWTFLEFPNWFRARAQHGWFVFAFVECKVLQTVPGGMAAITKKVVQTFFPADDSKFNFEKTGVIVKHNNAEHHIRATFGCWLADEKAIKEIVSCKGSSGSKPCVCCKNVVNRTRPLDGDYLVHVSTTDPAKFDEQTFDSLTFMACDLQAKVDSPEFKSLQQIYGLAYQEEAILFDKHCRDVARFPGSIFWDWMHCLVASGGVAQYECNQFCRALTEAGISLMQVDEFAGQTILPSSWSRLPKTFFRDRIVDHPGKHMKAFASEVITAVSILGLFVDTVLRPLGALAQNIVCFDYMRSIVAVLKSGDDACKLVGELRRLLQLHHTAFQILYPTCVKPKVHYLKHCVDCLGRFQCNLNCFGPERKHKDAKNAARNSFNKVIEANMFLGT